MSARVLDTNVLISFWKRNQAQLKAIPSPAVAREWGEWLAAQHEQSGVLTPIYLEFICGCASAQELAAAEAYLACFDNFDGGRILEIDWQMAERSARRITRDGKPRHLVDCLIAAIARRLKKEVFTLEASFPR